MMQMTHRSMGRLGNATWCTEALRSRDPLAAETAMRRHIEEPGEWIRNAVRNKELQEQALKASAEPVADPPKRATAV